MRIVVPVLRGGGVVGGMTHSVLVVFLCLVAMMAQRVTTTLPPYDLTAFDKALLRESRAMVDLDARPYELWTLTTNCGWGYYIQLVFFGFPPNGPGEHEYNALCVRTRSNGTLFAVNFSKTLFDASVIVDRRNGPPIEYLEDLPANATTNIYQNLGFVAMSNDLSINTHFGVSQAVTLYARSRHHRCNSCGDRRNLQNNSLVDISNTILPKSLKTFVVDQNLLVNVSNLTAAALLTLSMNSNRLAQLPSLANHPSLERLEVDANNLTSLSNVHWNNTPGLSYISAARNQIAHWPDTWPASLTTLNLQHNQLTNVTANFPPSLSALCLAGNPLQALYATPSQFELLAGLNNSACSASSTTVNATTPLLAFGPAWPVSCSSSVRMLWNTYPVCMLAAASPSGLSPAAVATAVATACVLVLAGACCWHRRRRALKAAKDQRWFDEVDSHYYGAVDAHKLVHDIRFDDALERFFVPAHSIHRHDLVARGGNGMVHVATVTSASSSGTTTSTTVAMKRMLPEKAADAQCVEDFMEEIRLCSRLQHKNIVQFIGFSWTTLQNLSALTEYMERGDLWSFLARGNNHLAWCVNDDDDAVLKKLTVNRLKTDGPGAVAVVASHSLASTTDMVQDMTDMLEPPTPVSKLSLLCDIVDGLVYLHSMSPPIIHRDLKAKNVLLDGDLTAKLADFGVSRETCDMTMTAEVGTVAWIAPEVLKGVYYSEKADVYSLGVVMSELDTAQVPYSNLDYIYSCHDLHDVNVVRTRLAMLVVAGDVRPSFTKECPPCLADLAVQCLSYHPEDRPRIQDICMYLRELKQQSQHHHQQQRRHYHATDMLSSRSPSHHQIHSNYSTSLTNTTATTTTTTSSGRIDV
ncbi:TKL protein kinase, variant 3 [Aphanomyces astaci]|uniref:TKL protein kinase, variant 3 n=1 Tax=Aphanomyces astaci TaxID=112090 RepID=W4H755_APHAT|nr:TKL protein kinase, variant 3 [Aphanomyces astaci]ETV87406.1 TKL protein kinase, variant 3 [Aphanomyces astaci]|eukprot:XP_009822268.1 TKL protein kinase, variant 3 [Aphanomyces astaci]